MHTPDTTTPPQRSLIPWLLMLGPMLALIGGAITLYLVWQHPDQEIVVQKVTVMQDAQGTRQHVVNSVTPPLK